MSMTKKLSTRLYELLKGEFEHSSKNLAKFSRKRCYMKDYYRILKKDDVLYIAMKDDSGLVNGAKLMRVACGQFDTWAFTGIYDAEDVTEWFITEYKEKGMCAYSDGWNHVWDEFCSNGDDYRKCKHCGKTEIRMVRMVPEIWWENA